MPLDRGYFSSDDSEEETEGGGDALYRQCVAIASLVTDSSLAPNEGSAVAMDNTIGPIAMEVVESWESDWPWVEAYEFYDYAMDSHECAIPCFQDSFEDATEAMQEVIEAAQAGEIAKAVINFFI